MSTETLPEPEEIKEEPKDPEFLKDVDKVLNGVVSFMISFPYITVKTLFVPSEIGLNNKYQVKGLTYFTVSLLLTSAFWYYYFSPTEGFISPVVFYLNDPNIEEITGYFFNAQSLSRALIGLIPVVICINLWIRLISYLFKLREKQGAMLEMSFYLLGMLLVYFPLFIFLFMKIVPGIVFTYYQTDIYDSTLFTIAGHIVSATVAILWLRALYIGTTKMITFPGRRIVVRRILLSSTVIVLFVFILKILTGLYQEKRSDIRCEVKRLSSSMYFNHTTRNYVVNVGIVVTNVSDDDRPVELEPLSVSIGQDGKYDIGDKFKVSDFRNPSDQLKTIYILKKHSAIYFELPVRLDSSSCRLLERQLADIPIKGTDTHMEGKIDIKADFGYSKFQPIEAGVLKGQTWSDIADTDSAENGSIKK